MYPVDNSSLNGTSSHPQDFFESFYFKLSIGICWFTLSFMGVIGKQELTKIQKN